ncbi:hypothetical protein [Niallia sp. 01092]|uniref:hypothetical protein n=1 Tax=unclassified Niallia TaxID=2837522 RepID=UPI003FD1C3DC
MKTFLVISQIFYLLCTIPWLVVFGFSFMSFDSGIHVFNVAFVVGIGLYPIAVVFCSIFAWFLQERSKRVAIIINLVPMVWIAGLGLPLFVLN